MNQLISDFNLIGPSNGGYQWGPFLTATVWYQLQTNNLTARMLGTQLQSNTNNQAALYNCMRLINKPRCCYLKWWLVCGWLVFGNSNFIFSFNYYYYTDYLQAISVTLNFDTATVFTKNSIQRLVIFLSR